MKNRKRIAVWFAAIIIWVACPAGANADQLEQLFQWGDWIENTLVDAIYPYDLSGGKVSIDLNALFYGEEDGSDKEELEDKRKLHGEVYTVTMENRAGELNSYTVPVKIKENGSLLLILDETRQEAHQTLALLSSDRQGKEILDFTQLKQKENGRSSKSLLGAPVEKGKIYYVTFYQKAQKVENKSSAVQIHAYFCDNGERELSFKEGTYLANPGREVWKRIVLDKSGVITFEQDNYGNGTHNFSIYNEEKKDSYKAAPINGSGRYEAEVQQYSLAPGTYWLKIQSDLPILHFYTQFNELTKNGGKSQKEAVRIRINERNAKGIIVKEDPEGSKYHYKFSVKKKGESFLMASYYGSGTIKIRIRYPNGKTKMKNLSASDEFVEFWGTYDEFPKGDYQVTIIKGKDANGWYEMNLCSYK